MTNLFRFSAFILFMSFIPTISAQGDHHFYDLKTLLQSEHIKELQFEIKHMYPHNKTHFTEGLKFSDGELFESIGLYGQSQLKRINLETGETIKNVVLPKNMFAEGITIIGDKIYQLTYKEKKGLIYQKSTFNLINTFAYTGEGWGLTDDGNHLIMSNGSSKITFLDTKTFKIVKTINVHVNKESIQNLNALEHIGHLIFANVFLTNIIIVFSEEDGEVKAWLDVAKLRPTACNMISCPANGIAHQKDKQTFLVTGKYWPILYQIWLKDD